MSASLFLPGRNLPPDATRRTVRFRPTVAVLALTLGLLTTPTADLKACTLWGAAGADASGGTIIAKNRDAEPDHVQSLKMRRTSGAHAYFGLYADGGREPGIKAGVNEKGLAVVTAAASSIPRSARDEQEEKRGVIRTLLSSCADCDEVLARKDEIFPVTRAQSVMIADRRKILVVEVGLGGRFALKTVEAGTVAQTNHYQQASLAEFNEKIGRSSPKRLERVSDLLRTSPRPLDTNRFAEISADRGDGADNSLWRTGKGSCTLASFIVETPPSGPSNLRVLIHNPGGQDETHRFVLDQRFWRETK